MPTAATMTMIMNMMTNASLHVYWLSLLIFHVSEFMLALLFDRAQCSATSLLLSWPYVTAMAGSLLEYHLSFWLFPLWKAHVLDHVRPFACVALLVGELIRKSAWITAQSSFTHLIQFSKRSHHHLVEHGVYRWCRHPGYLGWFIWVLSTQLLLANFVSFVVFAVVTWRFFYRRIEIEEFYLVEFFGHRYVQYRKRTPTWIPGIA